MQKNIVDQRVYDDEYINNIVQTKLRALLSDKNFIKQFIAVGDKGPQGDKGVQGDKGSQGDKGVQGDKGPQGDKGDKGERGIRGDKGDKGPQGIQGDKGDKGQ